MNVPEVDFFVLAQGGYVLDQRDPATSGCCGRTRIDGPHCPRRCG
jgi:hypothetical protein